KGFDLVDDSVIINELGNLNVHPVLTRWIKAFLTNRQQCVKVDCHESSWKTANGGLPQGTYLGPLLFAILVNPLLKDWNGRLKFVDDTTVLEVDPSYLEQLQRKGQVLSELDNKIFELFTKPEDLEADIIEAEDTQSFIAETICTTKNFIENKTKSMNISQHDQAAGASNNIQQTPENIQTTSSESEPAGNQPSTPQETQPQSSTVAENPPPPNQDKQDPTPKVPNQSVNTINTAPTETMATPTSISSAATTPTTISPTTIQHLSENKHKSTLLKTAISPIEYIGSTVTAHILFDEGSHRSFITSSLARNAGLTAERE
ncbi:Hypothetical predicted protein, partial [Paramuricea clavata]